MALSDIVQVTISTTSTGPTLPGFGVPLILGAVQNATYGTDRIRFYTGTAGMTSDGFLTTDPEYLAAAAIFSQKNPPPKIAVGRRVAKPTQSWLFTVLSAANSLWAASTAYALGARVNNGGNIYTATTAGTSAASGGPSGTGSAINDGTVVWSYSGSVVGKTYTVTVGGVAKSFTAGSGDTNTTIATGLAAAIGTQTGFGAAVASTNTVTVTASAPGNWLRVAVTNPNVDLDCLENHADNSVQAELTAIAAIDNTWYAVLSVFNGVNGATNTSEVGQIAAYCEANTKLHVGAVSDSTILGSATTDIATKLKTLNYARTALFYHPDNGAFAAAAWAGVCLPLNPGSETWKFKTLAGVSAVVLSATQAQNADGKNCNTYQSVAGISITGEGVVADREFIDTIRFRDWLAANMQTDIFGALAGANKIPYTDPGAAVIEQLVRARLQLGIAAGGLAADPAPTITVPKVATQATADRQARKMRNITWTAQLAGAIHSLTLNGTVSV